MPIRLLLQLAVVMFASVSRALAGERLDLERQTPVAANEVIPVQDFFRPAALSDPKLNSTGTILAASADQGDWSALLIYSIEKKTVNLLRIGRLKDLDEFEWLDANRLLSSWTTEKLYADGLYVNDADKPGYNHQILSKSATVLLSVPRAKPLEPYVWIVRNAYEDGKDMGVAQLDAMAPLGTNRDAFPGSIQSRANRDETNRFGTRASIVRTLPVPDGQVVGYLHDKDGEVAFTFLTAKGVFSLHRLTGNAWEKCPVDLDVIDVLGAGDRPGELIVVGPAQAGKPRALQRLDAVTGALGEVLLQDKAYNPVECSLERDPTTGQVIGVRYLRSRGVAVWFDEGMKALQSALEQRYPGMIVRILGSNEAQSRFVFATYSDRQPAIYHTLEVKAQEIAPLKASRPWIDPARMQPMNILRFKARDGHQLEAYVTLPAGASKERPAPLVVLPHGGPWVRDVWGFDGEVQFLASRGYAVIQPNYRGSTSYEWQFSSADLWDFRKMHDDVTDAARALIATGMVDARRVAIMGASFGGYLAACGAAFEPEFYRCAITMSGVFDWAQVMKSARYDQYTTARYGVLMRNLGDPAARADTFAAISPLRHVDKIRIPLFVAHGKEDTVAEVTESRALLAELKKHGVAHEALIVAGEGHGMAFLKNKVELYERVEAFLAKALGPRPAVQ